MIRGTIFRSINYDIRRCDLIIRGLRYNIISLKSVLHKNNRGKTANEIKKIRAIIFYAVLITSLGIFNISIRLFKNKN